MEASSSHINNSMPEEINSSFGILSDDNTSEIRYNPNNLNWTLAEEYYEIFKISGNSNNSMSNNFDSSRIQMLTSFLTFCRQDKAAFLSVQNRRPLENFFINILQFPVNSDHELQKLFLNMLYIYLKNNHDMNFYHSNFKQVIIKLMLKL